MPGCPKNKAEKPESFDMLACSRISLDTGVTVTIMRGSVARSAPLRAAIVNTDQIFKDSRKLKVSDAKGSTHLSAGLAFPVADLIQTFKPETWEDFTEEWAVSQEQKYKRVIRFTGANDMGH